jgi:putative spermidine/putrescine transport system ATP-binding protein
VALARALVFRPPLLLMDEPFGALDRTLRERLQGELRQLQRRLGITVLFVTHDQAEAMALSDRIVVIDRGRLQQVGRPEELYERPANPFVADFIGESNLLRCAAVSAAGNLLRVRTAGGSEFTVTPATKTDAARHLVLRPESLRLHAGGRSRPHAVEGVVEDAIYLGGLVKYVVRINPAEVLVVRAPKPPGARPLALGTAVQVGWEPAELTLL